jgi:menaquinol-cytochrome c reductase iron-sulfur subunit
MNHPEGESTGAVSLACDTPVGSRRNFFQWMIGMTSGLIALGLAIPLVGYVISPALKRRDRPWVDVGGADELPVGQPKQLDHVTTIRDGWMETKSHKAVWAVKQADGQVIVYSPICTHLGCGYRWEGADQKFKCPCHGSVYDVTGKVLDGPAPRRLDILPSKTDNGRLFVIYKEFKAGLPDSVEL